MKLTKEQVKDLGTGVVDETLKAAMIIGTEFGDEKSIIDLDDPEQAAFFRESFRCGYVAALVRLGVSREQVIQIVQYGDLEVEKKKDMLDETGCFCGECNKKNDND